MSSTASQQRSPATQNENSNRTTEAAPVSTPKALKSSSGDNQDGQSPSTIFNPVSDWEEPVEIPLLTLFDVHRKPREVITDPSARVCIPLKVLSAEFHCPVCLGYMKKTSIVMECLHRFCSECIQKCLRLGKKECPSCRIHIPSRRSLRPDPNFDDLIKNIYGDINALEKQEEKDIELLNKAKNMNNAYADARKRGIMQQAIHRQKKSQKTSGRNSSAGSSSEMKQRNKETQVLHPETPTSAVPKIASLEESVLVNFILRRHPQETLVDNLDRELIRTSGDITMETLKVFLSKKLSYEPSSHFQILTVFGGKGLILDDDITINEVQRDFSDNNGYQEPVLYFRIFTE